MGVGTPLLSHLLRQVLQEEELPARQLSHSPAVARRILAHGAPVGAVIEQFSELPRCMAMARQRIGECEEAGGAFPSGTVYLAARLSASKGRFQRGWHAPVGGVWLALALVNTLLPASTNFYSLAAGLACCEAVRHYGLEARTKWVNDLLVGGRKLAGILIETMRGPRFGEEYILIGVGVNVNNDCFPAELRGQAVSMRQLLGAELDLPLFTARLLAKLSWNIGLLHYEEDRLLAAGEEGGEHALLGAWRQASDTIGRRVRFGYDVQLRPQFEAEVLAVDEEGRLVLRLADGTILKENAGELLYLD